MSLATKGYDREKDMAYLISFCKNYDFPEDAERKLTDTLYLMQKSDKYNKFKDVVNSYYNDALPFNSDCIQTVTDCYNELNKFTVQLIFLILLTPHLCDILASHNADEKICFDTLSDLKWKMLECYNVYGVWGTFVGWWLLIMFKGERYFIGRLQYEVAESYAECYQKDNVKVLKGDKVIKIHIPSAGPLKKEDCINSINKAAKFFKSEFKDGKVVFMCFSWLLYDKNKYFVPENSNILKFAELFDVVENREDTTYEDFWRIFNVPEYKGNPDNLVKETRLQKGVYEWLKKGNLMGFGTGYIVVDTKAGGDKLWQ